MARLNLGTFGADLEAARRRVLDGDPGAQWALFVVDKDFNLRVQEVSGGTLEDLEEEFDSGKIQYAYARVNDPNSGLTKFVAVSWCGDGVPTMMKGRFNSQLADINNFLKPYHIQVTARNEDDVKAAYIMNKVQDSSGAKYSIHKEVPRKEDPIAPVGSVYKPHVVPDISSMTLQSKQQETPAPMSSAYRPVVLGDPGRLPQNRFGSRDHIPESKSLSNVATNAGSPPFAKPKSPFSSQQQVNLPMSNRTSPQTSQGNLHGSVLSKRTSPHASQASVTSPTSLLSKPVGDIGAASAFAAISRGSEEDLLDIARNKSALLNKRTSSGSVRFTPEAAHTGGEQRRLREQQEREEREREERAFREREEASSRRDDGERRRLEAEKEKIAAQRREAEERERVRAVEVLRKREEEEERERVAFRERQAEEIRKAQEDEDRRCEAREDEQRRRRQAEQERSRNETVAAKVVDTASAAVSRVAHALQETAAAAAAMASQSVHPDSGHSGKKCARVVYDFDAGEDNEMSLTEGEIITDIDQIDEGWWTGVGLGGAKSGMFPSNYVELINSDVSPDKQGPVDLPSAAASATAPERNQEHAEHLAPPAAGPALTATAAYDYTADEDNELTFREGDLIVNVRMTTEDWWEGETRDGRSGLFPANYVELNK